MGLLDQLFVVLSGPMDAVKKEELVREYLPEVDVIVQQEKRKLGISSGQVGEEMRAYALEGLADALTKYDPQKRTMFSTYAYMRVRGAIYDGLRQSGWFPRHLRRKINFYRKSQEMIRSYSSEAAPRDKVEAVHTLAGKLKELATAYITTYSADSEKEPPSGSEEADILIERKEFSSRIHDCISRLPDTQAKIIRNYFFLEQNLPKIAMEMNISVSWASKLLSSGLTNMRKSFGKEHLKDAIGSFESKT